MFNWEMLLKQKMISDRKGNISHLNVDLKPEERESLARQ